jgi:hypothetical protein
MNQISELSLEFWLATVVLCALLAQALWCLQQSWAKPAVIVYGTVGSWYLGDLLYTGQKEFDTLFVRNIQQEALLQVMLFLIAYRIFLVWLLPFVLPPSPNRSSVKEFGQAAMKRLFWLVLVCWTVLFLVGLWLSGGQPLAILWPPTSPEKVGMFTRDAVGGRTGFLLSTAGYVYELVCALFAVFFVLLKSNARYSAFVMVLISWPYFWFGRVRNVMLALLLPAMLCYWLFNRSSWKTKAIVSVMLLLFVNFWFLGVMRYREHYGSTAVILDFKENTQEKHNGLNMLEELCWTDQFIDSGQYKPNFKEGYLAEIANVVPRAIWPNKPMIDIQYDILRGQGGNSDSAMGVYATVATGLIGQGVANFGRFFGVLAAAFLMALWTGLLARLWRQRFHIQRLLLFLVGCGLTFNTGRDITLLVLWPFVFGYIGVIFYEKFLQPPVPASLQLEEIRNAQRPGRGRPRKQRPVLSLLATAPYPVTPTGNTESPKSESAERISDSGEAMEKPEAETKS